MVFDMNIGASPEGCKGARRRGLETNGQKRPAAGKNPNSLAEAYKKSGRSKERPLVCPEIYLADPKIGVPGVGSSNVFEKGFQALCRVRAPKIKSGRSANGHSCVGKLV